MNKTNNRKAVFFDRDGTINVDKNYVFRSEDFEFTPGIIDVLRYFQNQNYLIFIITNQSGIARGYYTEKDYFSLTNWMLEQLKAKGITITRVYHCPHHPDFTGECNCRKPKPGLILMALKEYGIDPEKSIVIGDSPRDIEAGRVAGIARNYYIQDLICEGKFGAKI